VVTRPCSPVMDSQREPAPATGGMEKTNGTAGWAGSALVMVTLCWIGSLVKLSDPGVTSSAPPITGTATFSCTLP
jgi:hypothetical protein